MSARGLLIKLRVQRHGHRLIVPFYLAAAPAALDVLTASLLPALLGPASRRFLVEPLRQRSRRKKAKEAAREAAKEEQRVEDARRRAALDAQADSPRHPTRPIRPSPRHPATPLPASLPSHPCHT